MSNIPKYPEPYPTVFDLLESSSFARPLDKELFAAGKYLSQRLKENGNSLSSNFFASMGPYESLAFGGPLSCGALFYQGSQNREGITYRYYYPVDLKDFSLIGKRLWFAEATDYLDEKLQRNNFEGTEIVKGRLVELSERIRIDEHPILLGISGPAILWNDYEVSPEVFKNRIDFILEFENMIGRLNRKRQGIEE